MIESVLPQVDFPFLVLHDPNGELSAAAAAAMISQGAIAFHTERRGFLCNTLTSVRT